MTSRNSSNISGFQLQDLAAVSNFSSALSSSLSLRPCSGHSLNFGTLMRRFHSSPCGASRARFVRHGSRSKLSYRNGGPPPDPWLCGQDACQRWSCWTTASSHLHSIFLSCSRELLMRPKPGTEPSGVTQRCVNVQIVRRSEESLKKGGGGWGIVGGR